tara:strand:- start:202 stop:744 length:543 start_codon:yes stop_codon:yes gene_type:complete
MGVRAGEWDYFFLDKEMRIYSEVEHGTSVKLIIPRGIAEGQDELPVLKSIKATGNGEVILLVEDEANLLAIVTDMLETFGYRVITAPSGVEALELVRNGAVFDLLLTDIVMPGGLDGFQLAAKLRDLQHDQPVVYMSGYSGFHETEMGEVIAPMVLKPCNPGVLAETIKEQLAASVSPDG